MLFTDGRGEVMMSANIPPKSIRELLDFTDGILMVAVGSIAFTLLTCIDISVSEETVKILRAGCIAKTAFGYILMPKG